MEAAKIFLATYKHPEKRIDSQFSKQAEDNSETNKHILRTIFESILLCGRQGLALRGHRDDGTADPFTNRGNFLAILNHTAKHDQILRAHLQNGKRNQQYTSKTLQNEVIGVTGNCLREKLVHSLVSTKDTDSKYFSVIADEVTDRYSNQEVLSLCLRFVDTGGSQYSEHFQIKEIFLDFLYLERTTGEKDTEGLIKVLNKHGL